MVTVLACDGAGDGIIFGNRLPEKDLQGFPSVAAEIGKKLPILCPMPWRTPALKKVVRFPHIAVAALADPALHPHLRQARRRCRSAIFPLLLS